MEFLTINGVDVPCPDVGLEIIISTAVNSGRNAQAEVIGEKVGRDVLKYNNLQWTWLTAQQWADICSLFDNFFVTARVWDMAHAQWRTVKMYPGDRSAEVYWIDPVTKTPLNYTNCKVNIIDCGLLSEATMPSGNAAKAITITDTFDEHGGTVRTIEAVSLAGDNVTPDTLLRGVKAHNAQGEQIIGTVSV